ncbi:MAG: CDF family Co(II)/Ni(II) efflux transporter DmeF [Magnetococcales bacterium]|nr:CDF family Co(II)/Ni(II) efflux transporter DmeF [Magnetococcales bacterium]
MHTENLSSWLHDHVFDSGSEAAERSTRVVMWITAVMMIIEIVAGWWFNSMALLADGWHMSSHAVAIGLSAFAYATARRYAKDPRFAFGTWKIEILGGFASAIFLLGVAVMMFTSSIERLVAPQQIHYQEAIIIAVAGLLVNVVCALILGRAHHHGHGHDHGHGHGHAHDDHHAAHGHEHHDHHDHHPQHDDLNLKSAYLHVIADAATSLLAIIALAGGWMYGWSWLDAAMGIVGAVMVAIWAKGLIRETGQVLLDREMDHPVVEEIREVVEDKSLPGDSRLTDLHVWRVGKMVYSCAMTVVTHNSELTADEIRKRLSIHEEIVHTTIEIHYCTDGA